MAPSDSSEDDDLMERLGILYIFKNSVLAVLDDVAEAGAVGDGDG